MKTWYIDTNDDPVSVDTIAIEERLDLDIMIVWIYRYLLYIIDNIVVINIITNNISISW